MNYLLETQFGEFGGGAVLLLLCAIAFLASLHGLCAKLEFKSIQGDGKRGLLFGWSKDVSRRMFFAHFWALYGLLGFAIGLFALEAEL